MNKRVIAAAVGAAALLAPASAVAKHDGHGKGAEKKAEHVVVNKQHGKKDKSAKAKKPVTFVFNGVYKGAGVVTVSSGNAHVRKGGFVGTDVTFDLASAKVVAAESDNVPGLSAGDLQAGDVVLVQTRMPRGTKAGAAGDGAEPTAITARKVVDKTHPPVEDETESDVEAEPGS